MDDSPSLPRVWVRPVRPEEYPGFEAKRPRPVTRGDLGERFHAPACRWFDYHPLPAYPPVAFRIENIDETLDIYTKVYDFGDVVWPQFTMLHAENWREAIDKIAERGLYLFNIWGYVPSDDEHQSASEHRIPDEIHSYIMEKLGTRFLGYDNGEQDGRYVAGYAKLVCPAPATRREAHEAFVQYFTQIGNDLQNHLNSLSSLYFTHYFAQMGNHVFLGSETAQALPSVPPWYAIIRGAGKQYGLLWWACASVWNRWGYKIMDDPEAEDVSVGSISGRERIRGPTAGTSLSLLRRLWYVLVMYGSVIMCYEMDYLSDKKVRVMVHGTEREVPALTEIGRMQLEGARWCREHPDRGELHTPVALLWDFLTGWEPPRHLYSRETYLVWGNIHYTKGDHQIDLILRELYPGYEDAGYCRNERGFLTPTPCGDIFDVLLSDAPADVISRYECVLLLGDTTIEGDLLRKLSDYVTGGGKIIACSCQLGEEAQRRLGIRLGEVEEAYHAIIPGQATPIGEPVFRYHAMDCGPEWKVWARTRQGRPLVVVRNLEGGGSVMVFASEYMLSNPALSPDKIHNETDQPLASPYSLLEHVKGTLLPYLLSFNLVSVQGPPIQYMVNVTERTDRLLVTLCNNSPQPWHGRVRPKRTTIREATDLLTDEKLVHGNGLELLVPPMEVIVVELLLEEPAFEVRG